MQLNVFLITLYVSLGIFLATGSLLIYTVWRFRAKSETALAPLSQSHGNPKIELTLIAVVSLLLLIIAVPNIRALFAASQPPVDPEGLRVEVTAGQWWWKFEYPELGLVTANELHIPVGRVVQARLRSVDVIHSFWVPKLAGKMDLIPNKENQLWFEAESAGVYLGQCAEFCGASHANMRFRVVAQSESNFDAWVQAQKQPAQVPTDAIAQAGEQLFVQRGCVGCHAIAGTAAQAEVGPNLTHFGSRQTLAAGILDNAPDNLARWLKNPQAVKPGSLMPNLGLPDDDITALVAYLQSLK
jgi:cytochrome c oxidase subunit 2